MAEFGALVKEARESRGQTGAELATLLGVAHSTLVRIERGQLANTPDPDLFWRISSALSLDPTKMLQVLGYLKPSADHPAESPAVTALRPILESNDLNEEELRLLTTHIRSAVQMLKGKH